MSNEQCNAVGDLVVGGHKVGLVRCILTPGHNEPREVWPDPHTIITGDEHGLHPAPTVEPIVLPGTPHVARLEWEDEPTLAQSWPDALDLDEQFDVDVDVTTPDPLPDDGQG